VVSVIAYFPLICAGLVAGIVPLVWLITAITTRIEFAIRRARALRVSRWSTGREVLCRRTFP
jgi:hypothetical protein